MNAATTAALTATLRAAGATNIRPVSTRRRTLVSFAAAGDAIFPVMIALRDAADAGRHNSIITQADTDAGVYTVQG